MKGSVQIVAEQASKRPQGNQGDPIDAIFTVANVISFIRLCMVPAFLVLLLNGQDVAATIVFAIAASTDFLDGQIARRTHTVSKLGRILDPAVDRLLMICGVLGVFLVGRVPLWIIILVVARDVGMIIGYTYLLKRWNVRVDVIYPGKVATTFFFIGFAALILNYPLLPGLGLCDVSWLPGFNMQPAGWGIWFIYAGLVLCIYTTVYYARSGARKVAAVKAGDTSVEDDTLSSADVKR
jgi:cardiolipin synthase